MFQQKFIKTFNEIINILIIFINPNTYIYIHTYINTYIINVNIYSNNKNNDDNDMKTVTIVYMNNQN